MGWMTAATTVEPLMDVDDMLESLPSGLIILDGFEGIYATSCCEEPQTAATGCTVAADTFSFSSRTAAVGVNSINCCLRTEYHRLAVPDNYRRVSPVCSGVCEFDLITKTLSNFPEIISTTQPLSKIWRAG